MTRLDNSIIIATTVIQPANNVYCAGFKMQTQEMRRHVVKSYLNIVFYADVIIIL